MSAKTAILLGASGSVGQALLEEVLRSQQFSRVLVMTRRALPAGDTRVEQRIVREMKPENLYQAVVEALRDCIGQRLLEPLRMPRLGA